MADPQAYLPRFSASLAFDPQRATPDRGILGPALRAGTNELQGTLGNALAAAGMIFENTDMVRAGEYGADTNFEAARLAGRQDLEVAPWREGGAPILPWLGYQATKQLPNMGAILAGGAVAPVGGLAVGSGMGLGSVYGEARERGNATRDDALTALGSAPLYGALEAVVPSMLKGFAKGTKLPGVLGKSRPAYFAEAALGTSVAEGVTEAAQTALELQVRPDLSLAEKASQIVDAALTGAAVGGVYGSAGGAVGAIRRKDPTQVTEQDIEAFTDAVMSGERQGPPEMQGPPEKPLGPVQGPPEQQGPTQPVDVRPDPISRNPSELVARDIKYVADKVRNNAAAPEDFVTLDAMTSELMTRAEAQATQTGRPVVVPDAVAEAQVVTETAIKRTREQVAELVGKKSQFTQQLRARNLIEAGAQILEQLDGGNDSIQMITAAEKLGLVNAEGRTLAERDIPAEQAALVAQAEQVQRELRVARTPEEVKRAEGRMAEAQTSQERLSAQVAFAQRVEAFRQIDPAAAVEARRTLDRRPVPPTQGPPELQGPQPLAPVQGPPEVQGPPARNLPLDTLATQVQQAPTAPVAPSTPRAAGPLELTEAQLPLRGFEFGAAPQQSSAPTALATALQPVRDKMSQTQQRETEFEAASAQQVEQSKQMREVRSQAEIAWDVANDTPVGTGKVQFGQLTPDAQRAWMTEIVRVGPQGTPSRAAFERIRRSRNPRAPATQFATPQVIEDPNVEPQHRRNDDGSHTITLSSGREVGVVYVPKGDARGWYVVGTENDPTQRIGEKGLANAARAVRDRAVAGTLPASVSTNPTNGLRFREGMPGTRGAAVQDIREVVAERFKGWGVDVRVANSVLDLPPELAVKVLDAKQENAMALLEDGKTVHLLANNIASRREAVAAVFHEVLGHKALAQQFRGQLDTELMRMYDNNSNVRLATDAWLDANPDGYKNDPNRKARATEEIMARLSEDGVVSSPIWDRLVALVKRYARRLGLKTTMTDREVMAILSMAHHKVIGAVGETRSGGLRFMYVGKQPISLWSNTAMTRQQSLRLQEQFRTAREMQRKGAHPRAIRLKTGWFMGLDGQWRHELDDSRVTFKSIDEIPLVNMDSSLKSRAVTLREVMDHPDLFTMYPAIGDVLVAKRDFSDPRTAGHFDAVQSAIVLSTRLSPEVVAETMLHEVQHVVQRAENWAPGSDSKWAVRDMNPVQQELLKRRILDVYAARASELEAAADVVERLFGTVEWQRVGEASRAMQRARSPAAAANATQELEAATEAAFAAVGVESWSDIALQIVSLIDTQGVPSAAGLRVRARMQQAEATKLKASTDVEALVSAAEASGESHLAYLKVAGEIEARDTEARRNMTPEERRDAQPYGQGRTIFERNVGFRQIRDDEITFPTASAVHVSASRADADTSFRQAQQLGATAVESLKKVAPGAKPGLRRAALYTTTLSHIADMYGKLFKTENGNPLDNYLEAQRFRVTIEQRMSDMALGPYNQYEAFKRANPKAADKVLFLMGMTQFNVDPRKTYDQQPWLAELDPSVRGKVREHAQKANQLYSQLKRTGDNKIYDDFVAVNEGVYLAQHTMALWNLIKSNPIQSGLILNKVPNPMEQFIHSKDQLHETPQAARAFWAKASAQMIQLARNYTRNQRGEMEAMTSAEAAKYETSTGNLERQVRDIVREQEKLTQAPYFHLGRFGDHYVAFSIRSVPNPDPTKSGEKSTVVDQKAVREVAKRLEVAGFKGIRIDEGTERRNVYIRTDSEASASSLFEAVRELGAAGLLDMRPEVAPARGKRESDTRFDTNAEGWMKDLVSHIQGAEAFKVDESMTPEQKAHLAASHRKFEGIVREFFFNRLPDTATAKVAVHRDMVPGFDENMVKSFAYRAEIGARSLANLTASSRIVNSLGEMRAAVKAARRDPKADVFQMHDVVDEFVKHENERPSDVGRGFVQMAKAFNHAYFLGMSPAYMLTNMTQMGVLLWPELSKRHGFVRSARAVSTATGKAFKVVSKAAAEALKNGTSLADIKISPRALADAGLTQREQDFVMRIINTGAIDFGSASRELGRITKGRDNETVEKTLRWASAFGMYSEVITRLTAAMADYELSTAKGETDINTLEKSAVRTIDQSMLNYASWNVSRLSGAGSGPAGPLTPLALSFMQYSFQLMEKLYREFYGAIKGETAAERAEARRFIVGHLAAVTVLAGSLGMPAATVLARVFDEIGDLAADDGEEPTDVVTAYREWLADTFGVPAAEVIARGVPRALGFDMSVRAGEQSLLPFSRMLADKRDAKDVIDDMVVRSAGSPLSMARNLAVGFAEFTKGNFVEGAKTMLPVALKGPIEAFKMTDKGYTDKAGNVLPMEAGAMNVLTQALGFSPAEKAEYGEIDFANTVRTAQLGRAAQLLRKNIATAIESGDSSTAREWIQKARAFDRNNPKFSVLDSVGRTVQQRARARAIGRISGLPIGVDPRDPGRIGGFGNY